MVQSVATERGVMGVPVEMIYMTAVTTLVGLVMTALWRKFADYTSKSLGWRDEMRTQMTTLLRAQQTTMRATLIHNAEKYFERGWLTPEERASWCDMHDQYSSLGANGLIETYRRKLDELPDRTIS